MSDQLSGEHVVYGFELIEATRRASNVPPEISADGEAILIRDGILIEFLDPRSLQAEVFGPVKTLAQLDDDAKLVLPQIERSVNRYFDRSSIIFKELPPEIQDKVREAKKIPGFRFELNHLLAWLEQPDVAVLLERINGQQLVDRFEMTRSVARILSRLPNSDVDEILADTEIFPEPTTLEQVMNSYFMQDGVGQALRRPQHEPLEKTWRWFNLLGHVRRASLIDSALNHCGASIYIKKSIAGSLAKHSYTGPYDIWFDDDGDDIDYPMRVASARWTNTDGDLAKRLDDLDDVQVDVVGSQTVSRRKSKDPAELYDVLLRHAVYRPALIATLHSSEETHTDNMDGAQRSRILGEMLVALLFMQEQTMGDATDVSAIRSIHHADPTERNARKVALGMILTVQNASEHIRVLQDRAQMVLEAKD